MILDIRDDAIRTEELIKNRFRTHSKPHQGNNKSV
jgi:hypothetical protein